MPKKLERLKIKKFRGVTGEVDFVFEADKPVILVFGENGTGKSTIVDALDFVCNQRVDTLQGRYATSLTRYGPSLGAKPEQVAITLQFGGDEWSGSIKSSHPVVNGPTGRPKAVILRRGDLLAFLDAAPADKYKALSAFIDVSKVEGSEQSLRDAKKQVADEIDRATQGKVDSLRELGAAWKAEGGPAPNAVEWAKGKAQDNLGTLENTQNEIQAILNALGRSRRADENRKASEDKRSALQRELDAAASDLRAAEDASKESDSQLLSLLEQAERYIDVHSALTACPVCEQSVNSGDLKARIAGRREAGRAVELATSRLGQAKRAVQQATMRLEDQARQRLQEIQDLANLVKPSSLPFILSHPIDRTSYPTPLTEAQAQLLLQEIEGLSAPIESARMGVTRDIANLKSIQSLSATLAKHEQAIVDSQPLQTRLKQALETIEGTRRAYIDRILKSVSGRVDTLYTHIHPNERVGGIRFLLDPDRRASLSVQGIFETASGIPPQAFYSESHLDTLGICIFLALAERDPADDTIVLLDDVLTSADQNHLDRFLDMVHDEFAANRQVILTTHYRPLKERYTYSYGSAIQVQMIDLLAWTHARGVRHSKAKLEIDELRNLLTEEPLDRQSVTSKAGVLLEAVLDKLTLLYGCRVRRKASGDYTLGDLLDGIDGKLRRALQSDAELTQPTVCLADVMTKLSSMTWIRNRVGAHFNRKGSDVPDRLVIEFGQATLELLDALVCPKCGELPRKHDGSRWHCGCKTRWLAPLALPGETLSAGG
jgi:energy-coupling factor transporter ATP-binding protein EcfA2